MWPEFIVENDFLLPNHFDILKSIPFDTDPNSWEMYKHQVYSDGSVKVSYSKNGKGKGMDISPYLSKEDAKDIHDTYNNRFLKHLEKLSPEKISLYKFTEINVVSTGKDYNYRIHNDSKDKLLSVVIYISPDKNIGTILYDNEDGENPHMIDWEPNKAFIFSRNDYSWHSYKSNNINQRITLVFNLRG